MKSESHGGFAPGGLIGRYRLLAPLATGGMAYVWAAKPEGAGFAKTIALKLVRGEFSDDEEYARMFIDEATVAAAVHHPNVCETYELGRHEGNLYMALEWVAGDSLAGVLHQNGGLEPLDIGIAARVIAEACGGLHAAHEAVGPDGVPLGIVHRDISPPNILLSLHGQVKVSDFGIAKARYQLHAKTRTGEIKGKFAYLAPEQILAKSMDRRADIYAMGCVLYVATLGLRPFGGGPLAMNKILSGDYKRPSQLVPHYPEELEAIIVRALQKDPANRFQTAEDMRLALEAFLMNAGLVVGTSQIGDMVRKRLAPEKREAIESLLKSNKFLPDILAYQLLDDAHGDRTPTPTATSGLAMRPAEFLRPAVRDDTPSKSGQRQRSSTPVVRYPNFSTASAAAQAQAPKGAARPQSPQHFEPPPQPARPSRSPSIIPDRGRTTLLVGIIVVLLAFIVGLLVAPPF